MNRNLLIKKNALRKKRKAHIRKFISGSSLQPRVSVFRSNKYVYLQAIDDTIGNTLASASSLSGKSLEEMSKLFADKLLSIGVSKVVFDRNGYKYHGNVKKIAELLRNYGLNF